MLRRQLVIFATVLLHSVAAVLGLEPSTSILNHYTLHRWGALDGLVEGAVNGIQAGGDGFVYITTLHHILRFDGIGFTPVDGDCAWNGGGGILLGSFKDSRGQIWIRGTTGIWKGDGNHWQSVPVSITAGEPPLSMFESPAGKVWIVTTAGICEGEPGNPARMLRPDGTDSDWRISHSAVSGGVAYISAGCNLWKFVSGKFERMAMPESVHDAGITGLAADAGSLYVTVPGSGFLMRSGKEWSPLPGLPIQQSSGCKLAATSGFWFGSEVGLFHLREGSWEELTSSQAGGAPLDVRTLFEDSAGGIWIGTSDGLIRLNPAVVRKINHREELPLGASERVQALIVTPPNNLLTGFAIGGLLAGADGRIESWISGVPRNAFVSALCLGPSGRLWVGTQGDFLFLRQGGTWRSIRRGTAGTSFRGTISLLEDHSGRLWIGTWDGLMTLKDDQVTPVGVRIGSTPHPVHLLDTVVCLLEDREGGLWAGYRSSGLLRISPDGKQVRFRVADGLPSDTVQALAIDRDGILWAGTPRGAVSYVNGRWAGNAAVTGDVRQILSDRFGCLWLGTSAGLYCVDSRSGNIRTRRFGVADGMPDAECAGGFGSLAASDSSGKLYFSTIRGIACVDPAGIPPMSEEPIPVLVERATTGGRVLWKASPIPAARTVGPNLVVLNPSERSLSVAFTALSFTNPETIAFRTKLEGYDENWSEPSLKRSIDYPRLPPGEYRFLVSAADDSGRSGKSAASLMVRVEPKFYETVWFPILTGLALLVVTALGIRGYERRRARFADERLQMKNAVERERSRMASDLHDDLGAGLTEVSLLAGMIQRRPETDPTNSALLIEISDKTREMVEALDEIVWAVDPRHDSLPSLASYLSRYTSRVLSLADIPLRIDLPDDLPVTPVDPKKRHGLFLAFREALTNIIRHAGAGQVRLHIALCEGQLSIELKDDGLGFDPAAPTIEGADGLANIARRLEKAGGSCRIKSAPGSGTSVLLSLPVGA